MTRMRQIAGTLEDAARHYTGAPCAHGHTLRHRANRSCVACQAEAQRARRAAAK